MRVSQGQTQEFMGLFTGSQSNYGRHTYSEFTPGKKRVGKSQTISNKLLTIKEYEEHLNGVKGLGIIPINESSKCRYSIIDVDVYDFDFHLYLEAIERYSFPLVPFKSKSGGLHLYIFYKEEVSPSLSIKSLRRMIFLLSIDKLVKEKNDKPVEVFPKQTKLSKGEVGNWVNLPYYNYSKTDSPALRDGKELSLNEALTYIKEKQTTIGDVHNFLSEVPLNDAPPCLQLLNILNPVRPGYDWENNYLFSFGVYLKKSNEEDFEYDLKAINAGLISSIPERDLEKTVVSSLKKRDYFYRCSEEPCFSFCNKKECKLREFGVGKDEGHFSTVECGQLYQYRMAQPYYEWEVKLQDQDTFKRLRFKSELEIIRQDTFIQLCMRELYELPTKLKQSSWFSKVNQHLKEIKLIQVHSEDDTSPITMIRGLIHEFITQRAPAETKDQIFAKRVYLDKGNDAYLFRIKDLNEFLYTQKQFRHFSPHELHGILRELKCLNKSIKTESRKSLKVAFFYKKDMDKVFGLNEMVINFDSIQKEEF